MEGGRGSIRDLDVDQLLKRLVAEGKLVAKGARALYENDVDGDLFAKMKDEEFKEIGLNLGVRNSIRTFRERVIEEEKTFADTGPGKDSVTYHKREPSLEIIAKAACDTGEIEGNVTEGGTSGKGYNAAKKHGPIEWEESDSLEFNCPPLPPTQPGESGFESACSNEIFSPPLVTCVQNAEPDCSISCQPKIPEKNKVVVPSARVEYKEEQPPSKSMMLSVKKKLGNFVFNREVKWLEQGKKRSSKDFMKLRNEEIVLEGYLQKRTNTNKKWKPSSWTSRYAILLKSGVLLNFENHRKTLFYKGFADMTKTQRIDIPLTDSGESSLKLDILTEEKRVVLGFSRKAEMQIWRDALEAIFSCKNNGEAEDEKNNKEALEDQVQRSFC